MKDYGITLDLVGVNKHLTEGVKKYLFEKYSKFCVGFKLSECIRIEMFIGMECNATDARQKYKISNHDLSTLEHVSGKRKNTKIYNLQSIVTLTYSKFKSLDAIIAFHAKVDRKRETRLQVQKESERKKTEKIRREASQLRIQHVTNYEDKLLRNLKDDGFLNTELSTSAKMMMYTSYQYDLDSILF
jgi:hypothetical protein